MIVEIEIFEKFSKKKKKLVGDTRTEHWRSAEAKIQ